MRCQFFANYVACNTSCRPEPEEADLANTATTIWQAAHSAAPNAAQERTLASVAAAYHQHYSTQSRPDFHGLRDFYAVISTLRLQPQLAPAQLYRALLRNFGGPAEQVEQVRLVDSKWAYGCTHVGRELISPNRCC